MKIALNTEQLADFINGNNIIEETTGNKVLWDRWYQEISAMQNGLCSEFPGMLKGWGADKDQQFLVYRDQYGLNSGRVAVVIDDFTFKVITKEYPSTGGSNDSPETVTYDYSINWQMYLFDTFGQAYKEILMATKNSAALAIQTYYRSKVNKHIKSINALNRSCDEEIDKLNNRFDMICGKGRDKTRTLKIVVSKS